MRSIFTIANLLFCLIAQAQTPNWAWAKEGNGSINCYDHGNAICTDVRGNLFITGSYNDSDIIFSVDTLFNNPLEYGYDNVFIAKYDASGNFIWARTAGEINSEDAEGFGVGTDASGNAYIIGSYTNGSIFFGNDTLNALAFENIFIAKYDSSGNEVWAKMAGGIGDIDNVTSISTDANGNSYITGFFNTDNIIFGSDTLSNFGNDTLHNLGSFEYFIAKYDASGNVIWAKSVEATSSFGFGVCLDAWGNFYTTGIYGIYGTGYNNSIVFGNDTLTSPVNVENVFVAKYDSSGDVIWAKSSVTNPVGEAASTNICTDNSGNVYVTGYFADDSLAFGSNVLIGNGLTNSFIVKYDSSGNALWAKNSKGIGNSNPNGISTVANGDVYVMGTFDSSSISFASQILYSSGPDNLFIVKYDSSGNVVWAKRQTGRTGNAGGNASDNICSDAQGNVSITGGFKDSIISFGADTLTNTSRGYNIFIAKLDTSSYSTVGVKTVSPSSPAIIYPNPSTGTFYFSGLQNESTIEVYNLLGEMVSSTAISSDNNQINLSAQAKGIYFYKIHSTTQDIQQGKIVIE